MGSRLGCCRLFLRILTFFVRMEKKPPHGKPTEIVYRSLRRAPMGAAPRFCSAQSLTACSPAQNFDSDRLRSFSVMTRKVFVRRCAFVAFLHSQKRFLSIGFFNYSKNLQKILTNTAQSGTIYSPHNCIFFANNGKTLW